jgi:hypothetical protein
MREVITYGSIDKGVLKIHKRGAFLRALAGMLDGRVKVTVKRAYRKRSTPQNAYYWGVVVEILCDALRELGNDTDKEQVHEILKMRCNPVELVSSETGEVALIGGSTKQMTTVEMSEYIERCRQWANEFFALDIPEANEQTEMKFE